MNGIIRNTKYPQIWKCLLAGCSHSNEQDTNMWYRAIMIIWVKLDSQFWCIQLFATNFYLLNICVMMIMERKNGESLPEKYNESSVNLKKYLDTKILWPVFLTWEGVGSSHNSVVLKSLPQNELKRSQA